ncbi:MAG: HAD family hydrolase [Candidatus Omnitrophota bacterium]
METKKIFIFDLDGTLADAYRAIEKSLNFTRRQLGLSAISYLEAKKKVGRGDRAFMETFFAKKNFKAALVIYRAHHHQALVQYSRLAPSVKGVLSALKRKKKILAIASNRPHAFTEVILKARSIDKYFDMVLCADDIHSNKPHPKILKTILRRFKLKKEDAVFVGDMDIDLETACRAGVDAVFIRGGSSSLSAVKKYKDKKVISSLKELLDLYE